MIARKLRRKWSPQQIAGWLKRKHPNEEQRRVSQETIYRSLYVQTRGVLKKELQECLRNPRAIRRSRHATQKGLKLRKIKNVVPMVNALLRSRIAPCQGTAADNTCLHV